MKKLYKVKIPVQVFHDVYFDGKIDPNGTSSIYVGLTRS